jgi:hypothetical protein
VTDQFDRLESDIQELKEWAAQHDEEHTADTNLLASIVKSLSDHQTNHHGRTSTIRQSGWVAAALTVAYVLAEIIRQFAL